MYIIDSSLDAQERLLRMSFAQLKPGSSHDASFDRLARRSRCRRCRGCHGSARAEPCDHRDGGRRRQPPRDQPRRLWRRLRDNRATAGPERAAAPLRRQQHLALQLAAQRRQPRRGLVLREHRGIERDAGTARRRLRPQQPRGQCRADGDHPDHRVRRQGGEQPLEARELRQPRLRRAGRLRLAVVSAGLQRHEGRTAGRRQQPARCQRAEQHDASGRLGVTFRAALRQRPRQAGSSTTFSTTSTASGIRRIATSGRPARRWSRCATR